MENSCPKINLLYYKNILDKCFIRFFSDFNDKFTKSGDDYIYTNNTSKTKLKRIFIQYVVSEIKQYIKPNSITNQNFYFIIGGCLPKNNILLEVSDSYFPEKLKKIIYSDYQLKYILKEKDIKLDLILFNDIVDNIFLMLFKNRTSVIKYFGNDYSNLFFIRHDRLSCYSMFKTLKFIFGGGSCVNIYKDQFVGIKTPIIAINDLIDKYSNNKQKLNTLLEFKNILCEIKQFVNVCLKFD